jgi:hypothetical protein
MMNKQGRKPKFEVLVARYGSFLSKHGAAKEVVWVFREDVALVGQEVYVRTPVPEINRIMVRRLYDIGWKRGLGVRFLCLAIADTASYCYIWLPPDELGSSYAMMGMGGWHFSGPYKTCREHSHEVSDADAWAGCLKDERDDRAPNPNVSCDASMMPVRSELGDVIDLNET